MVFVSLTSAYIFRRGLPTFDGQSNSYVRDWGGVDLPWTLLAINTATYWHALRANGINDRIMGFGRLLEEF